MIAQSPYLSENCVECVTGGYGQKGSCEEVKKTEEKASSSAVLIGIVGGGVAAVVGGGFLLLKLKKFYDLKKLTQVQPLENNPTQRNFDNTSTNLGESDNEAGRISQM